MRVKLKAVMEAALCGVAPLIRHARRSGAAVLAYHNVIPDGAEVAGDASLHLRQEDFARQVDLLRATHEIVPLQDIVRGGNAGPRAAITFDDAYSGAVTAAVEVLAALRLPATFFVVPGHAGGTPFWWDRLGASGVLTAGVRETALVRLSGQEARVTEWAEERFPLRAPLPSHARAATGPELGAALAHPGISFGSHTWSHPNLSALTPYEVEEELVMARDWLRSRFHERWVSLLSYPYGCWSPAVAAAAARTGHDAAFRIDGGWLRAGTDRYRIPRINIPAGVSMRGFTLRAAGVLGG